MLTIRAAAWLLMAAWSLSFSGHRPRLQPAPPTGFALVEWFTSEGCSSCPPADNLLPQLAANNPQVIPLSFHVDYWNYLGWADTLASKDNTDRQYAYARMFGRNGVYTPQAVLNGREHLNGADISGIRSRIESMPTTTHWRP
mgnify:CR=1 FL=1